MSQFQLNNYVTTSRSSVAIGVFDGVHLGHQAVLRQNFEAAQSAGLRAVCMTFEPHPAQVLAPAHAPETITCLSQKVELLLSSGYVDDVVIAQFDHQFAQLSPQAFVEQVLVNRLQAAKICVGADFRYGSGRVGSVMDLEAAGGQFGFRVNIIHAVSDNSHRISSTTVRERIASGDLETANRLIGREFAIRGHIIKGKQLGREIGFPTINLRPEGSKQLLPADGVYAGYTRVGESTELIRSAISVGTNPTTDGDSTRKVEAHLLDGFNADIYGERVDLSFVKSIRNQIKYESIDDLIKQIDVDVQFTKNILRNLSKNTESTTAMMQS